MVWTDSVMSSRQETTGRRNCRQTDITLHVAHLFHWIIDIFHHNLRAQRRIYRSWNEFHKTGNAGTTYHYSAFVQPLLQWQSNEYYIFCVCVYVCVCVFVAWVIQHAMRMRHIVICGLPPLYSIFPHYLINLHDFRKKKLLNTRWEFGFRPQLLCETFLILRRNDRDVIRPSGGLHVQRRTFLSHCNEIWMF